MIKVAKKFQMKIKKLVLFFFYLEKGSWSRAVDSDLQKSRL